MIKIKRLLILAISVFIVFLTPKVFNQILVSCDRIKCLRLKNSINRSKVDNEKWDFYKERIESGWHVINKDVINAKKYLYSYSEGKGLPGGYIDEIDQNLLLGTNGKGETFLYSLRKKKFIIVKSNLNQLYRDQKFEKYNSKPGPFGIRDLFFDKEKNEVYASLYKDLTGDGCYGMSIYKAKLNNLSFSNVEENDSLSFKKFFQTELCNRNFNGHRSGGRIKKFKNNIILTVGDLGIFKKDNPKAIIPDNKKNIVGQILSISDNGESELISTGHRNPQGLEIVNEKIFSTEHGPQGGDEINLIKKNKNYGWPIYSYGFSYGNKLDFKFPHETEVIDPVHYFNPSIGISEIKFYENNEFPFWNNKFLLTSLKNKSIYLLDFDDKANRFKSIERIKIGHRIRDIVALSNGKIVLLTDDQKLILLSRSKNDRVKIKDKEIYKYK